MEIENSGSVKIGSQEWTTENLNVSTFRNGDPIPEAKSNEKWNKASIEGKPAWCYYDNDLANGEKYGKLYNWYAVNDSRGLAPEGWHIPSNEEWSILIDYLGGENESGHKMKSATGWENEGNGDNNSGFSALPAGSRSYYIGSFNSLGQSGDFWSSSAANSALAYSRYLNYDNSKLGYLSYEMGCGFSIRCVRD